MSEFTSGSSFPEEHVLFHELNHRINNEFSSMLGLIAIAATRCKNHDDAKIALRHVADLLHNYVDVHRVLQMPEDDCIVDAAAYLRKLCLSITRSKLDRTKIAVVLELSPLGLRSDQCWLLGMIVHELVTNAARHAFATGQGEIRIELSRKNGFARCKVQDNGRATASIRPGRGLKIIDVLVKRLEGHFHQQFGKHGSTFSLVFPLNDGLPRAFHFAPQVDQVHPKLPKR
jgi:two-component sensor histidine kinase